MNGLIYRLFEHLMYRFMHDTRHALKAYRCLDEANRLIILEDMEVYANEEQHSLLKEDPEKCFQKMVLEKIVFRSLFYVRCRNCQEGNPNLKAALARSKDHLPPDPQIYISCRRLGRKLLLRHSPVGIGKDVIVGNNVSIGIHVVIGKRHQESPVIHDNVEIGAGSMILGGVDIGENAVIGAGAVVLEDVPANTVYAGVPARFLHELTGQERILRPSKEAEAPPSGSGIS